jgi:hypothetical protein
VSRPLRFWCVVTNNISGSHQHHVVHNARQFITLVKRMA